MRKRKVIISLLSLFLVFNLVSITANDYEYFKANEAHYKQLCSSSAAKEADNRIKCSNFNSYLNQKIKDANERADKYKGEMNKYKDDMQKQMELAEEYQAKIDEFASQIVTLESEIRTLEANIKAIEIENQRREDEIKEKDRIIIERMRKTQSDMRFGYEIDFLFKSIDFATLVASASIVTDIMEFEAVQIAEIDKLIAEQKAAQEVLELNKINISANKSIIEASKAEAEVLKTEVDIAVVSYQKLMNEMAAKQAQANVDASNVRKQLQANQDALNKLDEVGSSSGFTRPVSGGYLSAKVWAYPAPWSAIHIGYDYATSVGTPIRAAANGVIIASSSTCPTYGGLGNWCGSNGGLSGGGNQVHMVTNVNGKLYGILYLHMQSGSPIKSGTIVNAGQTIGLVGSSGNSTGPHVHVEVVYIGNESVSSYIDRWNGNLVHGAGYGLSNRCIDKGNQAPCRLDPGTVFGSR